MSGSTPRPFAGKTVDEEAARQAVFLLAYEIQAKAAELSATAEQLLEELERERRSRPEPPEPG